MSVPIAFTIDNLGDAADLQRGVISQLRPAGHNPALEQGYPALLELFARHQVPLTCFVEGWSARQYPDFVRTLDALGHEVGMHGWQHEHWAVLDETEARRLARMATDSITATLGKPPRAFRAPGGPSSPLIQAILLELGYDLDASHAGGQGPAPLLPGLHRIPYDWAGVDASHWLWRQEPDAVVEQSWLDSLDNAASQHKPFVFIWHPHVMGMAPRRLAVGERILRYLREYPGRFRIVPLRALQPSS